MELKILFFWRSDEVLLAAEIRVQTATAEEAATEFSFNEFRYCRFVSCLHI